MNTNEIYQHVTDCIIDLLNSQLKDWQTPWVSFGVDHDAPRNPVTARYYSGINILLLSYMLVKKSYLKNEWLTFNQIKNEGGTVKKGERSTPVVFYKTSYKCRNQKYYSQDAIKSMSQEQIKSLGISSIPLLNIYHVFNAHAQTENLPPHYYEIADAPVLSEFAKNEAAENLIRSTGAHIDIRATNSARYHPKSDMIVLPLREQFNSETESFYSTALHELVHWTGHPTRLDRKYGLSFGDESYAKEELIAELGASFLCSHLGFTTTVSQNAAYIQSWIKIMKEDNKAILKATADAQKAANFILSCANQSPSLEE